MQIVDAILRAILNMGVSISGSGWACWTDFWRPPGLVNERTPDFDDSVFVRSDVFSSPGRTKWRPAAMLAFDGRFDGWLFKAAGATPAGRHHGRRRTWRAVRGRAGCTVVMAISTSWPDWDAGHRRQMARCGRWLGGQSTAEPGNWKRQLVSAGETAGFRGQHLNARTERKLEGRS